jgi:crotonobetainyl-CoA:carnitine CoA-transferase CaiB-like acyl-CoA transferase
MSILADIRVVELASVLAGPNVGMFLAEQGAQVIKVENKTTGGDVTRFWRLPDEDTSGLSAYFCAVNAGKNHIFLDLLDQSDRKALDEVIRQADILILNFKPGDAEKFDIRSLLIDVYRGMTLEMFDKVVEKHLRLHGVELDG